jgi:hypothetical protein
MSHGSIFRWDRCPFCANELSEAVETIVVRPGAIVRRDDGKVQAILRARLVPVCRQCASTVEIAPSGSTLAAMHAVAARGWKARQLRLFDDAAFAVSGHRGRRG